MAACRILSPLTASPPAPAATAVPRCRVAVAWQGHRRLDFQPQPLLGLCLAVALPWRRAARSAAGARAGRAVVRSAGAMVQLVVGEGQCPWGEGGSATMIRALGFGEPVAWPTALQQLARKLRQAVPGLEVQVAAGHAKSDGAKLLVLIDVDPKSYELQMKSAENYLVLSPPGGCKTTSKLTPRKPDMKNVEEVLARCTDLWARDTAEDCFYALLFAIHFSVTPVPLVDEEPKIDSFDKIWRLCSRCLGEALKAGLDAEARACLACQSGCDVRDQTQMYRCTVSHESERLAQLVRCFERRGIFDCNAEIPDIPFEPLKSFQGRPLDHDTAWRIMEGHWSLEPQSTSWRPVLGQNPAYDYFPSQYNTWYRDPRGNRGWYDPVFKVVTLDGTEVWRKRHYRVLLGSVPGSFQLSTEDNGISLREFWRIVDADDGNLSWVVMHYAGAAKSVGQSYTGSLLLTKDGLAAADMPRERIRKAFEKAGVAPFELYAIHQEPSADDGAAPLTDFRTLKRYAAA